MNFSTNSSIHGLFKFIKPLAISHVAPGTHALTYYEYKCRKYINITTASSIR